MGINSPIWKRLEPVPERSCICRPEGSGAPGFCANSGEPRTAIARIKHVNLEQTTGPPERCIRLCLGRQTLQIPCALRRNEIAHRSCRWRIEKVSTSTGIDFRRSRKRISKPTPAKRHANIVPLAPGGKVGGHYNEIPMTSPILFEQA